MPYFPNRKIVQVSIPRTSSMSASISLGMTGDFDPVRLWGWAGPIEMTHMTAMEILSSIGKRNFEECVRFTIVRNPFDRLVSEYHYRQSGDARIISVVGKTFLEFARELDKRWEEIRGSSQTARCHFIPQVDFICDPSGNSLVKILRFEDRPSVSEFLVSLGASDIQHANRSVRSGYRSYYDDESRGIVEKRYAQDFDFLGYERECYGG